jgi:hypothetical protein
MIWLFSFLEAEFGSSPVSLLGIVSIMMALVEIYLIVLPVLNLIQLGICLFCLIFLPSLFLSLKAFIEPYSKRKSLPS